jgi:crossover junction endodeoxyribonuclease RuvC
MRILGIDPGLNTTGYGVIDFVSGQPKLIEAGIVRSKASGSASLPDRIKEIHDGVSDVIASLKPEVLAIEELYTHYDRPTTAILMGHARGVILLSAAKAGIPVESYPSTQIKKTITGNGHAAKWQMQEAIRRELNLPVMPEPPDVADALAIALCHCYLSRHVAVQSHHTGGELRIADCGLRNEERQSPIHHPQSEIRNPPS